MDFISTNAVMISSMILLVVYVFIALEKIPKVTIALISRIIILWLIWRLSHLSYRKRSE